MIIANENELIEPVVVVPLGEYEEQIRAVTKLEMITDLVDKVKYIDEGTLRALLGLDAKGE